MTPPVSIIVPYRDHRDALPRLLESVQRQSLKDLEVIIVDDKSEHGCADIVAAFAGRGLCVRLLENERHVYVRDARIAGVREARADCFMFADADDMLWGDAALETHVAIQRENQADIVHFRSVITDGAGNFVRNFLWADPFAPRLNGNDIFSAYTRSEIDGGAIWNKIFAKSLWLRILPDVRAFPPQQLCEDICMNIHAFFQARSYVGSDLTGYGYHFRPGTQGGKSLMRAVALCRMRDTLIPCLRSDGGNAGDLDRLERVLLNFLAVCAGRAGIHAMEPGASMEDLVNEALMQEDYGTIIKTLLLGVGVNGRKVRNMYRTATATM
jgi:hypothetical protein